MDQNEIRIRCTNCGKSNTGVILEMEYTLRDGKEIRCMHCGKKLEYPYKDVERCMEHSSYARVNGAIKQTR